MVDMLTGLHAAHELVDDAGHPLQIVHRDVSPQNVLVGVEGSSRLTDFGVARATSKLSTTQNAQLKGKLAYMAPEQARGTKNVDRRADIFAAGVVMWEALTGKRLFRGDGEGDTFSKVLKEPIPLLGTMLPAPPTALDGVLARALNRDREERYPTAAAFADGIERAVREAGFVATHRDVAKYLQSVLGGEMAQQRNAVRSWIARHPNRPGISSTPPPPNPVDRSSAVSGVTLRGLRSDGTVPTSASIPPAAMLPVRSDSVADRGVDSKPGPARMVLTTALVVLIAVAAGWLHQVRTGSLRSGAPAPSAEARAPLAAAGVSASPVAASVAPTAPSQSSGRDVAAPSKPPAEPGLARLARGPRPPVVVGPSTTPGGRESLSAPDDMVRNPYR
jgi:serine/threonine-protein kinase